MSNLMKRQFIFQYLVTVCMIAPPMSGQETDSVSPAVAAQDAAVAKTVEFATKEKLKLAPPEFLNEVLKADVEKQFEMLPHVSPRGTDSATRSEMVSSLLPLLKSKYPDIRARAATAISLFGEESHVAIPELIKLMGDREATVGFKGVWTFVSKALSTIGTASIQPAMETVHAADRGEYYCIASIVSDLGDTPEARATAPYFLEQLKNGPDDRKWANMFCLSKLGDAAKPAVPDYMEALKHAEFNRQVVACRALAALGKDAKAAIPKLVQLTGKEGNMLSTRTHAAMSLGAIGPVEGSDVDLVELFKKMIAEPNAFSQERGLIALGRLGAHAKGAEQFVAEQLENEGFSQRPEAALTLWQITGNAERSVEILRPMIDDNTYEHRALEAIKTIGPDAAPLAEALVERLNTDDSSLHLSIAEVLESMGPVGAPYVEKLRVLPESAPADIAVQLDAIIARLDSFVGESVAE